MKRNTIESIMKNILANYVTKDHLKELTEKYDKFKMFNSAMLQMRQDIDGAREEFKGDLGSFRERFDTEIKRNQQELNKAREDIVRELAESTGSAERYAGAISEEFQNRLTVVAELTISNTDDLIKVKEILHLA